MQRKQTRTEGAAKVAVRITVEAENEPSVNVEAVVKRWLGEILKSKKLLR